MLTKDIHELREHARTLSEGELSGIPLFITDVDNGEPDEANIWCSFTVNPDLNAIDTVGQNNRYRQLGIATLQINQPKDLELEEGQLDAWEIAEVAMSHFRPFVGSEHQIQVYRFIPQRVPASAALTVNLLIYYRSRHTD